MDVHVVSHTHWDREWYHSAARFRQRLVRLIDELLDAPEQQRIPFLLDGQTVLLEDYLAVRPDRRDRLAAALRSGELEAGPWYVLADELLPGGESLVRNLLAGRAMLRQLGASAPPVLYSPDAFGHPAALPRLAAGFGFPLVILWRGYGGPHWPAGDVARWRSDDGSVALLWHLPPSGYETGSSLPLSAAAANARWRAIRPLIEQRSSLGVTLLPNGADHHALQESPHAALRLLAQAAAPHARVRRSSLGEFAEALVRTAENATFAEVQGELRDSYGYAWTLQGTLATRTPQKRRAAQAERLLLRDVEPWVALVPGGATDSTRASLAAAWRTLLRCHPHDTLCGCSIDEVARAMNVRLESVQAQGEELRTHALAAIIGHDAAHAREKRDRWRPMLVVRNRAARPRAGLAEVELLSFLADEPVGPGSASAPRRTASPRTVRVNGGHILLQHLERQVARHRIESPRHYPDNDLVLRTRALCWVPAVPGLGCWAAPLLPGRAAPLESPSHPVRVQGHSLDNGLLRVEVDGDGCVTVRHPSGELRDLLDLELCGDVGDSYTPSLVEPLMRGQRPESVRVSAVGPLRGTLELRYAFSIPASRTRARVARHRTRTRLVVRLSLDAEAPFLRISVSGDNFARDHRLRLVVRTGVPASVCWADAAFGPVRRGPPPTRVDENEQPLATAPLHRYVSCYDRQRGATLYSDGLSEYELLEDGAIAVTLVRAIGELSRDDLPERPGHAGWPAAIPEAQCLGPFGGELALLLHGPRDDATIDLVERVADDVLLPLCGGTVRDAVALPDPRAGMALEGEGLALLAVKPAEDADGIVVRCVNLLDRTVDGALHTGFALSGATLASLDESPHDVLVADPHTVRFVAPPRASVTIILRRVEGG